MKFALVALSLSSAFLLSACSEPDLIVTDRSGVPIEGAKVTGTSLSIGGQTTTTNEKGEAQIPAAVQETPWIAVSKPGYEDVANIDVTQRKPILVRLTEKK